MPGSWLFFGLFFPRLCCSVSVETHMLIFVCRLVPFFWGGGGRLKCSELQVQGWIFSVLITVNKRSGMLLDLAPWKLEEPRSENQRWLQALSPRSPVPDLTNALVAERGRNPCSQAAKASRGKKTEKKEWLLYLQMNSSGGMRNNPIQPSGKCISTELTRGCKQTGL